LDLRGGSKRRREKFMTRYFIIPISNFHQILLG
jgi:hypothetical protein